MVSASQAFKMYKMVNKYLKNREDAKAMVLGIEGIIDERFLAAKDALATKEDIIAIKADIAATKAEAKTDLTKEISRLETKMEQGFKDQLKWLIVLMFTFSSLIIAFIKLT